LGVLSHVRRAGFSRQEIERFIIPARTWRHRKAKKEPLSLEESDRVVRLARIQAMAEDVFGDVEKAARCLREGGVNAPLALIQRAARARTHP
jgi:putative toxin-antitoxin system antitoxin component (TIGR02293 family)